MIIIRQFVELYWRMPKVCSYGHSNSNMLLREMAASNSNNSSEYVTVLSLCGTSVIPVSDFRVVSLL